MNTAVVLEWMAEASPRFKARIAGGLRLSFRRKEKRL